MKFIALLLIMFLATSCDKKYGDSPGYSRSALLQFQRNPFHFAEDTGFPVNFIENQRVVIESETVLREAVQRAALAKIWSCSEDEAVSKLSGRITVARRANTDLIEIKADGIRDEEAVDLLDAVINGYLTYYRGSQKKRLGDTLDLLTAELQGQADLYQENRKALNVLQQQYGTPYFENHKEAHFGRDQVRSLSMLELKLSEALIDSEASEEKLNHLRKLYQEWKELAVDLSLSQHQFNTAAKHLEESGQLYWELNRRHIRLKKAIKIPRVFVSVHKVPQVD